MTVDFQQIQDDLVTLITNNVSDFNFIDTDMDEREHSMHNMPLADVTLNLVEPEPRAAGQYVQRPTLQVEIVAFDLSSSREAAIIRNDLLQKVQQAIVDNPQFSGELSDTLLGNVEFQNARDEDTGAFISGCRMLVHCRIDQY